MFLNSYSRTELDIMKYNNILGIYIDWNDNSVAVVETF